MLDLKAIAFNWCPSFHEAKILEKRTMGFNSIYNLKLFEGTSVKVSQQAATTAILQSGLPLILCVLISYMTGGTYNLKPTLNDKFFWETFHRKFIPLSEFLPEIC